MEISFKGKVAIVTGAGNGLGKNHALELARRGAKVVVNDFGGGREGSGASSAPAQAVVEEIIAAGGEAIANAANVCDLNQVQEMVKQTMDKWGRVDILINNAGVLRDKSFSKMTMEDFKFVVDVHLQGSANCTHAVWEIMKTQNYGRILMTTSTSGMLGNFGQANYGAAKAGVVGLMNVLHLEGARYNIKVNALAPTAATRMTAELFDEKMLAQLDPKYVTPAALYLVSEDAPSRTTLLAGAGTYAKLAIVETQGVYFNETERTPESIAAHFDTINNLTDITEPPEGGAHVMRILKNAMGVN